MSDSDNTANTSGHGHHEKPHYDDVNAPVLFVLAIISAIVTFAIVATVQGAYYQFHNAQFYDTNYKTMGSKFVANEQDVLDKGSADRGITKIEDAMKKAVADVGGKWKRAQGHSHDGVNFHSHDDKKHDSKDDHSKAKKDDHKEDHAKEKTEKKDDHDKKEKKDHS